mmetsp:Transcript_30388/g.80757  ORF Transcript_30388/g.80757 Transcript_30388/m.80757 type:complete len:237 (-) Transcript_30388:692-1402(-)
MAVALAVQGGSIAQAQACSDIARNMLAQPEFPWAAESDWLSEGHSSFQQYDDSAEIPRCDEGDLCAQASLGLEQGQGLAPSVELNGPQEGVESATASEPPSPVLRATLPLSAAAHFQIAPSKQPRRCYRSRRRMGSLAGGFSTTHHEPGGIVSPPSAGLAASYRAPAAPVGERSGPDPACLGPGQRRHCHRGPHRPHTAGRSTLKQLQGKPHPEQIRLDESTSRPCEPCAGASEKL